LGAAGYVAAIRRRRERSGAHRLAPADEQLGSDVFGYRWLDDDRFRSSLDVRAARGSASAVSTRCATRSSPTQTRAIRRSRGVHTTR
jgi:hypothetical protein